MNEPHDPLIDALLSEALGGAAPPDLSGQIMARLASGASSERAAPPLSAYLQLSEPVAPPKPEAVQLAVKSSSPGKRRAGRTWPLWWIGSMTTVAAAVLLLLASAGKQRPVEQPHAVAPPTPHKSTGGTSSTGNEIAKKNFTPSPKSPETLPAHPSVAVAANAASGETERPSAAYPVARPQVPDREVVAKINRELHALWEEHGVKPSATVTDEKWLERVFQRLLGRSPTAEEREHFVADRRPDRRERALDELLTGPGYVDEFAQHWAGRWTTALLAAAPESSLRLADAEGLRHFLRLSFADNLPYDRLVRELLVATGSGQRGAEHYNGAANFLLAYTADDALEATACTSRLFLGVDVQCAQCHDHPSAPVTQQSFWAMNAFFRQLKTIGNQNDPRELADLDYLGYDGRDELGRVFYEQPDKLVKVAAPALPSGARPQVVSGRVAEANRRHQLADLVTQSPEFAQAAVNRFWSDVLGFGFNTTQADAQQALSRTVSEAFAADGYDVKRLVRWIALSEAFDRSAGKGSLKDAPELGQVALFSRAYEVRTPREPALATLAAATKLRQQVGAAGNVVQARRTWLAQRQGDKGSPAADIVDTSADTALPDSLRAVVEHDMSLERKVEHLFLATLGRKPRSEELAQVKHLQSLPGTSETTVLGDIYWALTQSADRLP